MKDPESMLLHVPCDGCSHVTHPSQAETEISTRCPVSSGECSRFSWQPRAAPFRCGCSAIHILPAAFSPFSFCGAPGVSSEGVEPTCRALFDPQFAFLVQHSWVAEK